MREISKAWGEKRLLPELRSGYERGDGMSSMIRCDKCKKMMYADSRSDKGDWCTVRIDYVDGMSTLHLCKVCHRQFLVEFVRTMKPEEYDDQFGSWWEDEVME